MKKKVFKVTKSKEFERQYKNLPKGIRKEVDKAISKIAKNPKTAPHSMRLGPTASAEELKRWMSGVKAEKVDLVFEYLYYKDCLNKKGEKLANAFWNKYVVKRK